MVNHHDVLVGLVHGSGSLGTRTNGRTAVWDGRSGRLDLRPLEKLGEEERIFVFSQRLIYRSNILSFLPPPPPTVKLIDLELEYAEDNRLSNN